MNREPVRLVDAGWGRERTAAIRADFTMAASHKRTFSLPAEQARYIDNLVASGTYATCSEVIRAGLRALQERDAAVDRWLRDEVAPIAGAMQAIPDVRSPSA